MITNNNRTIQSIYIHLLDDDRWDSRNHNNPKKHKEDELHIEALAKNIGEDGLLHPISVVKSKKKEGRYSIVAGRFRTLACKRLGWKTIPCEIYEGRDENTLTSLTIAENWNRKDLDLDEKIAANIKQFEIRGYKPEDILYLAKKIHNFGTKNIPDTFLDALEKCDYSANYLYQVMQTLLQIHPKVIEKIKAEQLSLDKRILLTHTKLRKHPKIAIQLIKRIKGLSTAHARLIVRQEIYDLETGAIVKQGRSYIVDDSRRTKLDNKIYIEKSPAQHYLELMENITSLMYLSTGHRLPPGEFCYEPNHVEYSERHRINVLQGLTKNEILKLETDIEVLKDALSSWLHLLNLEAVSRKK